MSTSPVFPKGKGQLIPHRAEWKWKETKRNELNFRLLAPTRTSASERNWTELMVCGVMRDDRKFEKYYRILSYENSLFICWRKTIEL